LTPPARGYKSLIDQSLRLPRRPDAAAAARRAVDALREALDEDLVSDLRLLVTELIATRVGRPGPEPGGWLELDVALDTDKVHAEVRDFGPRRVLEPSPFTFEPEASSGWSIYLIDRLSDRWALSRSESITRVWFELDV
jgi:anti-sigma regulatory factor (Ser/Thr protein kinase)